MTENRFWAANPATKYRTVLKIYLYIKFDIEMKLVYAYLVFGPMIALYVNLE